MGRWRPTPSGRPGWEPGAPPSLPTYSALSPSHPGDLGGGGDPGRRARGRQDGGFRPRRRHLRQPRLSRVINTATEGIFTTCRVGSAGPAGPGLLPGAPAAEKRTCSLGPRKSWGDRHSCCPGFQKACSSQAFRAREARGESPPLAPGQGCSFEMAPRALPPLRPCGSIPQSATAQLPTPASGFQGSFFSAVSSWGWGPRLRRSQGAAHREPGPGTWMTGPGTAEGPGPPKLPHGGGGGAKTPREHAPRGLVPRGLVEQGWLGWADNGGPAGRSRGSSTAKRIKTDGEGRGDMAVRP